jgi:hypothetical protein
MAKNKYSSMDASRDARGRINPQGFKKHIGAFRDDPGGEFIDEDTPLYLATSGTGYNPSHMYNFTYGDGSGKDLKTTSPLSQEEYETQGYTLKKMEYQPVNRYSPTEKTTTKLGPDTATKDNPFIKQTTHFKTEDGVLSQKSTYNQIFKRSSIISNYDTNTSSRQGYGSNVSFYSKPSDSGSNVITNLKSTSPISMNMEKGNVGGTFNKYSPGMEFFFNKDKTGAPSLETLSFDYRRGNSRQRTEFRSAIGRAAWNILRGTTTKSTESGRKIPRFY